MLRIAIVEDEDEYLEQIQTFLRRYEEEHGDEFRCSVFRDGSEILQDYQPEYDIILLDIEMPKINGMEAAEGIRRLDPDVVLVFITNMAQYAINGYAVGALDFILKPVNYYTFSTKLTRAMSRVQRRTSGQVMLVLPDGVKKLDTKEIYYVEVQNRMLHYHTEQGELILRGTMQGAEEALGAYHFVRCNYWYLVNLQHVTEIRKDMVIIAGDELEISRRNKTAFLTALTDYVGGGGA